MEKKEEKLTFSDKLGKWILKNRVILISILVVLFVGGVVSAIAFSAVKSNTEKKYAELYALSTEYNSVTVNVELSDDEKNQQSDDILAKVLKVAEDNSKNGLGIRAYMLAAEIQFNKKDYAAAAASWDNAAKINPKAYTAPLCLYNASVCYEELGNIDGAIANIKKACESENFTLKSKAIFNLGRLEEGRGNFAAAAEYYNDLVQNYSSDEKAKFAKSRLIFLTEQGKLN
ncbi:MAG: tetratricopeptide repeat protein [Spirochaetaceae bacterium]|nr:tetratricopeptide repeat protein [Spirochaetaceae bacterium]